ncbi:DNA-binding response regulator, OmpR family, contains REC and winged-helix (wHTH) domain [Dethiosulfatibacter aminovorans DSM 17477]|uniref:DNA-binding response regulator, OmpR family, contains REC and winged-helix (WHTH) domain n=1 Tax=Dethiosulfatibacter aminovorans DSM 17477 TaxID=1121476 RepID=A0A1M6H2T3_9FIRM|nr:response regulator transcription factor [Dethiosulfatibacter aminovorans]SHJ16507.1 DNA-binding response regulator, OmpR family, contains REC and winged-helix (wHTH) domain [Dethiosulfatibacter aminovorans DSM 17477]
MDKKRILIIEDEKKIARFLELELQYEGYEVDIANDGRTGLEMAMKDDADLIVLDLMLPGLSGIEICRRLRGTSDVPIIMLTAKDDVSDKVMGLDVGADDYMTKPFAIEELLARIRVLLKRKLRNDKNEITDENKDILSHDKLKLYKDNYRVEYGDDEIELTKKEFELLEYLMINKNIVLSREKILENVWGYDYFGETNLIDVYIRYLRGKIDQKYGVDVIKTVRGVGYIIRD